MYEVSRIFKLSLMLILDRYIVDIYYISIFIHSYFFHILYFYSIVFNMNKFKYSLILIRLQLFNCLKFFIINTESKNN